MPLSPANLYRSGAGTPWDRRTALLHAEFSGRFGKSPGVWCSAPGRTELGGNHTDHNRGRVLAAAVQLDAVAAAAVNGTDAVTVWSAGYDRTFVVQLEDLAVRPGEEGNSSALIRGVIARLRALGYDAGGFDAAVHSDVAVGSGLSSSAAFEVLIGVLVNTLFNSGRIPAGVLAAAGQFAENRYFGKPCGLMDQLASAVGGASHIDFADPTAPVIESVPVNPDAKGYSLCVVQTGGSHADLTHDYASIPAEMRAVARQFDETDCRDLTRERLLAESRRVRTGAGDRAFLRALHFVDENQRVLAMTRALRADDFETFLDLVNESGRSSATLLQNCWAPSQTAEQGVAVALALTGEFLREARGGACRVHGGGFAGTIQAYIPTGVMPRYVREMESSFGPGSVLPLLVRPQGAGELNVSGPRER